MEFWKPLIKTVIVMLILFGVVGTFYAVESHANILGEVKSNLVLSTYDSGFWYYWGDNGQLVVMQTGQDTVECPCGSDKYWPDRAGVEIDPDSARAEFTRNPPSVRIECWLVIP